VKERYALVVCDCQSDHLRALPEDERKSFLTALELVVRSAREANWLVVFTGYRFSAGYSEVPSRHRIFGGLKRLNARQGDATVHWFLDGYDGSNIEPEVAPREGEHFAWRQTLRPGNELLAPLRDRGATKVVVTGLKASQGVLATCHALVDAGMLVYVISDCVADDDVARKDAVLEHVLPGLADVKGWEEFRVSMGEEIMMDMYAEVRSPEAIAKRAEQAALDPAPPEAAFPPRIRPKVLPAEAPAPEASAS